MNLDILFEKIPYWLGVYINFQSITPGLLIFAAALILVLIISKASRVALTLATIAAVCLLCAYVFTPDVELTVASVVSSTLENLPIDEMMNNITEATDRMNRILEIMGE